MTQQQLYIDQQRRLLDPALGLSTPLDYLPAAGGVVATRGLIDPVSAEPVDDEEEQRIDRQSAVHLDPTVVPAYAVGDQVKITGKLYDVVGEQDADDPALVIRIIEGLVAVDKSHERTRA